MATNLLFALIALLPGAISWWSGRRLARRPGDPALPELLAAHRRRNRATLSFAIPVLAAIASLRMHALVIPIILGFLIAVGGLIGAAYPLRRALYQETWRFGSYVWFYPRVIGGIFGFWIVLATLPALAARAGRWDWLAGAALAGLLVLWNIHYADVVRFCLRTRLLPEGHFLDRCRALADACGVPRPRFERIDLGGGVIVNALALPSLRTSSVLFTDTMLERFDDPELLAICAHELAHFEHYNPAYLRRLSLENYGLIALAAACASATRIASLDSGPLPELLWFGALLSCLVIRARGKQRQETSCDLRAVELTGDPEALVRGLTKLYTIARMPRRIEQQQERAATHPSLARRIRDIRKAAGAAPAVLSGAPAFTSADGRTTVVFGDAELRWTERDAVTHSINYPHLTELRVDAGSGRDSRLVAIGAGARRWDMPLADADVARLQAVLDVVDGKIGDPERPPAGIPAAVRRSAVMMAAVFVLTLGQVAVAFVALLAWLKPSVPLLAAAGFAAFTAAAIVLRDHTSTTYALAMSLPLAGIGLVFLASAWGHRRDDRARMPPFVTLLALSAVLALAALAMNGVDAVRLHQSARTMPAATVLLVALAGALACSTVPRARLAAAAAGIAALATTAVASTAFLDRFAHDPLRVDALAFEWVVLGPDALVDFDVPSATSRIGLSPDGRYVAAYQHADSDEGRAATVQVGRIGEALTSFAADDGAFAGGDRLLVAASASAGTTLNTVRLGSSPEVVQRQFLEGVFEPSLFVDGATGRWRMMGRDDDESLVRAEGIVGTSDVQKRQWRAADSRWGYIDALATAGSDVLVLEKRYDRGLLARVIPWQWTWAQLLQPYNQVSRYTTIGDHGRRTLGESKLGVDCLADVLDHGLACTVDDGTRTHVVTIDAGTGHVAGIGSLEGRFASDGNIVRGWLTGWAGSRPVAIRLATGEVLDVPPRAGAARLLSVGNDRIAVLVPGVGHSTVRVYPLPPDTQAARVARAERRAPDAPASRLP